MQHFSQAMSKNTNTAFKINQELIKEYTCEGCGQPVKVMKTLMPAGPKKGEWVIGEIGCNCELLERIKKEQQMVDKARIERIFTENSNIPDELKKASFNTFLATTNTLEQAKHNTKEFVEHFSLKSPSNLFFQGTFGTGKSHLGFSVAKELKQKGYSTIFISVPKLLTKLRSTYNNQSAYTEDKVINTLCSADLVVFDDIGSEGKGTDWGLQKTFEIIDQRMGKNNIYTTNLTSMEFDSTKEWARIFSRLMNNSKVIVMNGRDYRKNKFFKGE